MELFLVDGTYGLFRHYYVVPSARDKQGREVGTVRGVLSSELVRVLNLEDELQIGTRPGEFLFRPVVNVGNRKVLRLRSG